MHSALSQMLSVTFLGVRGDSCVTSSSDNIFLKINLFLSVSLWDGVSLCSSVLKLTMWMRLVSNPQRSAGLSCVEFKGGCLTPGFENVSCIHREQTFS